MGTEQCMFPFKCAVDPSVMKTGHGQCCDGSHREWWGLWRKIREMSHLKGGATTRLEPVVDNVETQAHCCQNLHIYKKERKSEYL